MKIRKLLLPVGVASLFLAQGLASHAVGEAFAQFTPANPVPGFQYNGAPNAAPDFSNSTFSTVGGVAVPVRFKYLAGTPVFGGAIADGVTDYAATLIFSATSNDVAFSLISITSQSLSQVSFKFVADPGQGLAGGPGLRTLLEGVVNSPTNPLDPQGLLSGINGASAATLSGSDQDPSNTPSSPFTVDVVYTSNYLNFAPSIVDDSYVFSFVAVNPVLTFNQGLPGDFEDDFINSFVATGSGTFASNFVPAPGSLAAALLGVAPGVYVLLRRRK